MSVPTTFQTHESFLSLWPLAPTDNVLFVVFFIHVQNAMHIVREYCRQVLAFACSFESLHSEKVDKPFIRHLSLMNGKICRRLFCKK